MRPTAGSGNRYSAARSATFGKPSPPGSGSRGVRHGRTTPRARALWGVIVDGVLARKRVLQRSVFVQGGADPRPGAEDTRLADGRNGVLDALEQVLHFVLRHPEIVRVAVVVDVGGADDRRLLVWHDEDLPVVDRVGDDPVVGQPA